VVNIKIFSITLTNPLACFRQLCESPSRSVWLLSSSGK